MIIHVATHIGTRAAIAQYVSGPFALHASTDMALWAEPDQLVITHTPTGYAVLKGIRSKEAAMVAIEALMGLDVDWSISEPLQMKRASASFHDQIQTILRKCLKVRAPRKPKDARKAG